MKFQSNMSKVTKVNFDILDYSTLPFADDFCLISANKRHHQKIMNEIYDNNNNNASIYRAPLHRIQSAMQ